MKQYSDLDPNDVFKILSFLYVSIVYNTNILFDIFVQFCKINKPDPSL